MYYSIRQIEVFLRTTETLSITKTAQALNMTVPAAWKHIHNLEQLCQKQLFSRQGKTFLLTPEGVNLAKKAEVFLQARDQLSSSIGQLHQEEQSIIHLSITNTFQSTIFSLLRPFLTQYPHIQLKFSVDKWGDQQENLEVSQQDFFIISDPLAYSSEWQTHTLLRSDFVLTASSFHPLAHKKVIDIHDLKHAQFLSSNSPSATHFNQIKLMKKLETTKPPLYLDSYMAIREAVKANMGIAILPKVILNDDIDTKKLAILPYEVDDFSTELVIVYKKNKYQTTTHQLFKDFLINESKKTFK
ncbi:LysR family transcriptional regulator [Vibrio marisflavi]|uniref:HTH-type transcriptional activator CmpR n=1 Tax=Vibrio marisflavi CECT 7928 TaxID=634439 RepID=A0ABN8E4F8_9VIBR|nr:LysR family transcriptional regulator [Vibrio marisflavi]CAH0538553.1 HTH-type transcriptional activator CmpR [Vibrio marisflavi CECT 7928]